MKWFTALMTTVIVVLLMIPAPAVPDVGFSGIDIVVHLALFGLWGAAVAWEFRAPIRYVVVSATAFALTTEVLQTFAIGRTFSWLDIAADIVGSTAGAAVVSTVVRTRRQPNGDAAN